jgi:hypothetical protein
MLLLVLVIASVALVPVFGGRPLSLAEMRLGKTWLLLLALGLQVALVLFPGPENAIRISAYVGSYVIAAGFLVANRRIPGLWLIALGAGLNFAAIVLNGGVMPAAPHAMATAGLPTNLPVYSNSIALAAPKLALLGDIFAIPATWPFSNVFSLGDVCIGVGAVVTVHRVTGSRLVPSGSGRFEAVVRDRPMFIATVAHGLASSAAWTLAGVDLLRLAERTATLEELTRGAVLLVSAALISLAVVSLALIRVRASGRALVGVATGIRVGAILSLSLTTAGPSLAHLALVAGLLGAASAAAAAARRGALADGGRSIASDASRVFLTGLAVSVALPLASVLVRGGPVSVALLALPAALAGWLLLRVRSGSEERTTEAVVGSRRSRLPLLVGCAGLAVALPLQPAFSGQTLGAEIDPSALLGALAFASGVFGAGLALGAVAAPALSDRVDPARLLSLSLAVVALLVPAASTQSLAGLFAASFGAGISVALIRVSSGAIARMATGDALRSHLMLDATCAVGLLLGTWGALFVAPGLDLQTALVVGMTVVLTSGVIADRPVRRAGETVDIERSTAPG